MAIEASLTGHLVLSTLHTNSAAETVTRLLDMGMDPFNFADSLLAVLAQRLVRRLCAQCRTSGPLSDSLEQEFVADHLRAFDDPAAAPAAGDVVDRWRQRFGRDGRLLHWHSGGCESCDGSGLSGRAGLHELMPVSRRIRQMIQTGSHTDDLLRQALAEGMGTLRQDGIEKVLQGVSSIDEVRANS
jgi:type II secretory ATPase GspE/PulE/Tfp pilus assembly ATPase PilB-like protein